MEVGSILDDAQALRLLTLANEHLMICLCGVDVEQDGELRVLQEVVQKIVRIKAQMSDDHLISLAKVKGSRLVVEQGFTRNVDALVAAVPGILSSPHRDGIVDLDTLLADAVRYFSAQQETECQRLSSFRMLLIYRQVKESPQLHVTHKDISNGFSNERAFHLDVIYWYRDVPLQAAQIVFDKLCSYDNTNPLAKSYFLEVGGSVERLHQALVLMLSHPAHRLSQNGAEQLLSLRISRIK